MKNEMNVIRRIEWWVNIDGINEWTEIKPQERKKARMANN